jgi:molecular chaperone HtpG
MSTGKINVAVENIFPLIKKFLYSDHEIFLRELISNATDATTKLQHLSSLGEIKGDLGDLTIEVKVDKKAKKIHIIDKGVGMSQEEVQKYINEVAFSGAEEFMSNTKILLKTVALSDILVLGFTRLLWSQKKWKSKPISQRGILQHIGCCDGSPEYSLKH